MGWRLFFGSVLFTFAIGASARTLTLRGQNSRGQPCQVTFAQTNQCNTELPTDDMPVKLWKETYTEVSDAHLVFSFFHLATSATQFDLGTGGPAFNGPLLLCGQSSDLSRGPAQVASWLSGPIQEDDKRRVGTQRETTLTLSEQGQPLSLKIEDVQIVNNKISCQPSPECAVDGPHDEHCTCLNGWSFDGHPMYTTLDSETCTFAQ